VANLTPKDIKESKENIQINKRQLKLVYVFPRKKHMEKKRKIAPKIVVQ
jgi:hypothetical protein